MIADRSRKRRFREGFIVGFKEGWAEGWAELRAEQCRRRIRQILDHPPTALTPEMRYGLAQAFAEPENAPIPAHSGRGYRRPNV